MANAKKPKIKPKKVCLSCTTEKNKDDFYASYNKLHADGRIPYCKTCLMSMVDVDDINSVKEILRKIDKPFIGSLWESSLNNDNIFGTYMKNVQMPQYKHLTWKDSASDSPKRGMEENEKEDIPKVAARFKVTPEMVTRWGSKHSKEDIMQLEKFFHDMMDANRIETPQEVDYLKKLAVISLRMNKELEEGNYDKVKKLGDLFSNFMKDSQLRAIDKTDATKTGGIRTFSQIYAEVEKDGHIPPWEQYRVEKKLNQDIVDKSIMYILNYTHKLNQVSSLTDAPSDVPVIEEGDGDES